MKAILSRLLILGVLATSLTGPAVHAAEKAEGKAKGKRPDTAERQRQREELEKLTPEEREARRKQAIERREAALKRLREKKAAGSLTEAEKTRLERLETQEARAKDGKGQDHPPGKRSRKEGRAENPSAPEKPAAEPNPAEPAKK